MSPGEMVGLYACDTQRCFDLSDMRQAPAVARSWLRLQQGDTLREHGRHGEADAAYGAILADDPESWQALEGLGHCARWRGDLTAAVEHFTAALTAATRKPSARLTHPGSIGLAESAERDAAAVGTAFDMGLEFRRDRHWDESLDWFRRALELEPGLRSCRIALATTLRDQGKPDQAEAVYQELLSDEPNAWQALAGLGQSARLRGDAAGALERFAAAIAAAPAPAERWLRLEYGGLLREHGRLEDAETIYRGLLKEEPALWRAMAGLGQCARLGGDSAAAIEHFSAALAAGPTPSEDWLRLEYAGALRDEARAEDAAALYRAALADDPKSWRAMAGLGHCARLQGDSTGALGWFADALAAAPEPIESWLRLEYAGLLRAVGRSTDAEPVYRALLKDQPTSWQGLAGLAQCARARGDAETALEQFAHALEVAPASPEPWLRLEYAGLLRERGRAQEAEAVYLAARADDPTGWRPLAGLAQCARVRGALAEAAQHWAAALSAAPTPPEPWLRLEYAGVLRERGRAGDAEAVYRAQLNDEPGSWRVLAGLGQCAQLRGDLTQAAMCCSEALAAAPAPLESWLRFEYAGLLRAQGRADDAEAVYRELLADEPGSWRALAGLGQCARLRRDLPSAVEQVSAALAAAPAPLESWLRLELAGILREQGQAQEAERVYRALLGDDPQSWHALAGLAQCARQAQNLPAAAEHFAAALNAAPAPPETWLRLEYGALLRQQGRMSEAEAVYRETLTDDPRCWAALAGLAQCARLRGDLPAATEHFAAALAAAPQPTERWLRLEFAGLLRQQGRAHDAEAVYRALLADEPDAWEGRAGVGQCARLRGDLPAALEHFAAALAAAPARPERWLRLEYAGMLREQGRPLDAETVYRALLSDEPDAWEALAGLGQCARLLNDREGARRHFLAATEVAPDAEGAWFELAGEHRDAGRFEEARAILRPRLELGPSGRQAWFDLGHVEREALDRSAALQAFQTGYARHPDRHDFLVEIGVEEWALGRYADAESSFLRASAMEALAAEALALLGEMLRDGQQPERALELFERALALPSAPPWARAALAQTLADLGRPDEAFAVLSQAERGVGRLPDFILKRAALLRRAGLREEALVLIRDAAARNPTHVWLWFEWFESERFSDDPVKIERCMAAAPIGTKRDRAHFHAARGMLAEQRWRLEEAAAEFVTALELDASHSGMHESLARISLLLFDVATTRKHLSIMKRLRAARQVQQGLSRHLSHTHIGNVTDEFLMDKAALGAIKDVLQVPLEVRVERLLPLVRAAPGHTPTAIALLVALRQTGKFEPSERPPAAAREFIVKVRDSHDIEVRARDPANRIPANMAQYWDGADAPADIEALMNTWRLLNPSHRYVRFDHDSAQAFLSAHCTPDVLQAYLRARMPAMRADLFRLAYLFAEGGCYSDADDRCIRSLGALVPPHASFVAYQEDWGTLGNNFLAAAPLHPVIGLALQLAVEAINRGDDDLLWLATGPGLISRAFAQVMATSVLSPAALLEGIVIHDRPALEQAIAMHCAAAYKNSRRHWSRAAFGQPKPVKTSFTQVSTPPAQV